MFRKLLLAGAIATALSSQAIACENVNINTANAKELARKLDGVGVKKAESIVTYREKNGDFADADELDDVAGIGPKTVEKNRECIKTKTAEKEAKTEPKTTSK